MIRALAALAPGARAPADRRPQAEGRPIPQQAIVGGDQKSLTIAAASILAKTARDERMREMDQDFPGYGFAKHKGYPVKAHFAGLQQLGACAIHRRSFVPVRIALGLPIDASCRCPDGRPDRPKLRVRALMAAGRRRDPADQLFSAPLAEFITTRGRLAAELRKQGDKQAAAEVKAHRQARRRPPGR